MAQVFWEQIRNQLPAEGKTLSGSLGLSGSFSYNGLLLEDLVLKAGLFRQTGSFWATTNDIQITGSLGIQLDGSTKEFTISVTGSDKLKVNTEGVLQFISQSNTPTPVEGGIFYSSSDAFFLGFNS